MERVKIDMEYIFRASPAMLYKFFTEPAQLIRWFCDEVDIDGNTYTFVWEGSEEVADLIEDEEDSRLRFQWEDADDDDEYYELRMNRSPVTGETILEITDFCDDDEVDDQRQLWDNQMAQLRQEIGG
ncbi:MAG: START-like domain-containing protein [Bacteroidota bacterium]